MTHQGVCPTCGNNFESKYPKKFCSHPCYAKSPLHREVLAMSMKARGCELGARITCICANCGKEFHRTPKHANTKFCTHGCYIASGQLSQPRVQRVDVTCLYCESVFAVTPGGTKDHGRQRRFCSPPCFRRFFAERFDRWVASPERIPLPQNYDEFLSQEELPCLIDGCEWVGKHLGMHVSHAHGITADEFKRIAGFNRNTCLATEDVFEKLSAASLARGGTLHMQASSPDLRDVSPRGKYERRKETSEHQSKMIRLIAAEKRARGLDYHGNPINAEVEDLPQQSSLKRKDAQ